MKQIKDIRKTRAEEIVMVAKVNFAYKRMKLAIARKDIPWIEAYQKFVCNLYNVPLRAWKASRC